MTRALMLTLALVLAAPLGACGTGTATDDFQITDDLQDGPGLFSGEDGRFTLYSGDV